MLNCVRKAERAVLEDSATNKVSRSAWALPQSWLAVRAWLGA